MSHMPLNTVDCRRLLEGASASLSQSFVKAAITQSLRQVFGIVGGAIQFDVLEVKQDTKQAFVKVDKRYVHTWPLCRKVTILLYTSAVEW